MSTVIEHIRPASDAAATDTRSVTATKAPLSRLLRSEMRLVLRRPRTLIALGLLALVPVVAGIGIAIAASNDGTTVGDGIAAIVAGNGLALPIFALIMSLPMLLPMTGAMWAADALAGEAANGTMRNLLIAPVSRTRLLAVKAFGVATMSVIAVLLMALSGVIAGMILLGGDGMLTMSGTTLPFWSALGKVLLAAALVAVQVWAIAAIALAVSSWTEHPLIVMAVSLGLIIVFGVLGLIPALDWLDPVLLTTGWDSIADVLRDPMPTGAVTDGVLRAACYIVIGYSLAQARMLSRDG